MFNQNLLFYFLYVGPTSTVLLYINFFREGHREESICSIPRYWEKVICKEQIMFPEDCDTSNLTVDSNFLSKIKRTSLKIT